MKQLIIYASLVSLVSCSTVNNVSRETASVERDLSGTYLGVADYGRGYPGPNKKAIRIYFQPIEGESSKYNVVLLEYVNLLKMAPSYIASNKLPFVAKKTGYLKNITRKIFAYEAVRGEVENTYELRPLVAVNDRIEAKAEVAPRILTLDAGASPENPLEGATLSSVRKDDPKEIFFPMKNKGKKAGHQYKIARTAYKTAKLESTWRMNFLKGPYLSQYYNKKDVVLKLKEGNVAEFVINPDYVKTNVEKRKNMFTSPKSAFLKGTFNVTEPRDGMFLFHSVDADEHSKKIVHGKVGLFIDIFDATKSLNQDVVELCLIDSENPEDFLMYYEHPENGEGTDPSLH